MIVVDPLRMPEPGLAIDLKTGGRPEPKITNSGAVASVAPEPSLGEFVRESQSARPLPLGGVPRALREAAESSGIDPIAELFNEASSYAKDRHLRLARERLQMLLCMAPDDGDARLLLAQVHVAGQKWREALAALQEAENCGVEVPKNLRRAVEDHLQAEEAADEDRRTALMAREQGELKTLRMEAKRLRVENAQLAGRSMSLESEARKWAWATAAVSGIGAIFLTLSLLLGGGSSTTEVADAGTQEATEIAAGAEANTDTPASEGSDAGAATLAARAAEHLAAAPTLEGTELKVSMQGASATLTGTVTTHRQRKNAKGIVEAVSGVESVDVKKVKLIARTRGTTYKVESGDTLGHIAYEHYGSASLTKPIEKANKVNSRSLRIGQTLKIPAVD